jgi:hypothetical protein
MAARFDESVSDESRKPMTWRRVPWTCFWGSFDSRGLRLGPSGERCFWQCFRGGLFNAMRPLQKGDCEVCPYWQPRHPTPGEA